jgi:hypothetical protein
VGDPVDWEDWGLDWSIGISGRRACLKSLRQSDSRVRGRSELDAVNRGYKTGIEVDWCGGRRCRSSTLLSSTSRLSGGTGGETRLEVHDRRRLSGLSGIADSHASHGTWTSRHGKACGDEVCVGWTAWKVRNQRRVVAGHDVFVVFLVVALLVRDVAELTGSALNSAVCVAECAGSGCLSSVRCRERTVDWVEVVVVFREHGVGFYGAELGDVDAIRDSWLVKVDTLDIMVSQEDEESRDPKTYPYPDPMELSSLICVSTPANCEAKAVSCI